MTNPAPFQSQDNVQHSERYTPGYGKSVSQVMQHRTAASHAAFFTPHLHVGMRLLDCGCGPGSITIDLAEIVAPGDVIGIDIAENQLEQAKVSAQARLVSNVRFEIANIHGLPFPDGTFDAVFSHAVVEHLREPATAINEMHRVLKPGGVLGIRNADRAGELFWPPIPELIQMLEVWNQLMKHNGGDPFFGRRLRSLLNQAGCVGVIASASYECHGTPGSVQLIADAMPGFLSSVFGDRAIELGLMKRSELDKAIATWQEWGNQPDAFWARSWCEAVGWKQ